MIFRQRSPALFAPSPVLIAQTVVDAGSSSEEATHLGVVFDNVTGASTHQDYLVTGANLDNVTVSYESIEGAVDISGFPLIKRAEGVDSWVAFRLSNGRGETKIFNANFNDQGSYTFPSNPHGLVPGSYAKYSYDRVHAVCNGLSNSTIFDADGLRLSPSQIPHEFLTGHMYAGGWYPGGGKRFTAITPRVIVGCAHYGLGETFINGSPITFKTANNVSVVRTVVASWSGWEIAGTSPGTHAQGSDISFYLLDSDLPASIKPFKIVGPWIENYGPGYTDSSFTKCPQQFGLILFNNYSDIAPCQWLQLGQQAYLGNSITHEGFELTWRQSCSYGPSATYMHYLNDTWSFVNPASVFYHNPYFGDSGSPIVYPVAGGEWALGGIISGVMWDEECLNWAISLLWDRAAALYPEDDYTTPQTVTVAADPTL